MGQCKKDKMEQEDNSLSCRDICNRCGDLVSYVELDTFKKTGYCGDCAVRCGLEDS